MVSNVQTQPDDPYVPPDTQPGDGAFGGSGSSGGTVLGIADMVGAVTPWRSVNFARKELGIQDYSGTWQILAVTSKSITLADPTDDNASWAALGTESTAYMSPSLRSGGQGWAGPFVIDDPDCDEIVANFFCPQGLFRHDKSGSAKSLSVTGVVEVTPCDANGNPTGPATTQSVSIVNMVDTHGTYKDTDDTIDQGPKGKTLSVTGLAPSRYSVRFRRSTPTPDYQESTWSDQLVIRDCFGLSALKPGHFGNVTTVYTISQATSGAASLKERKFNAYVTRKLPVRNPDDTFGPATAATRNVADIICAMALDPYIGGRQLNELDVPGIYATSADVASYFGFPEAAYFDYTFDQDDISFEEMVQTVAQAVFCTAYRQGSMLKLFFEKETPDSSLLFNHRNKHPGTEVRTVRFGTVDDADGVELDYTDSTGQKQTVYIPADQSATKPKSVERNGVTDSRVATLHAWRLYNRLLYQHTTVEFDATAEASQLVLNERIEIADNTRPDTFDGYVVSQEGLVLELSQPFDNAVDAHVIFLQLPTGVVDVISVTRVDDYHVTLGRAPIAALALDPNNWADVPYQLVKAVDGRPTGFLLTEKGPYDKRSVRVQAINYDPRYYQNDLDFHS